MGKKNQFPSFSVDLSQCPGISGSSSTTFQLHVSACTRSVRLPHSLSQETWASAKVYLVLEVKGTLSLMLLPWFTSQKAALVLMLLRTQGRSITGPQASWTASEIFLPWGLWVQHVRIKRKGRGRRGKLLSTQPSTHMTLFGAVERIYSILITQPHAVSNRPLREGSWEFSVLRYLFQGFLTPTQTVYTSPHLCYSVLFNFAWLSPLLNYL